MKKIGEGIYVQDFDDYRSYLVEAEYSEHIKTFTSKETAEQEIELRNKEQAEPIADYISEHDFLANLAEDNLIFVETEEPTRLVKELCEGGYINIEQATAIMAYEIEHIRNPDMQKKINGAKQLKEVREIVIQYKINSLKNAADPKKIGPSNNNDTGKNR